MNYILTIHISTSIMFYLWRIIIPQVGRLIYMKRVHSKPLSMHKLSPHSGDLKYSYNRFAYFYRILYAAQSGVDCRLLHGCKFLSFGTKSQLNVFYKYFMCQNRAHTSISI